MPPGGTGAAGSLQVDFSAGALSVEAHDVPVQDLLAEIGRETGLIVSIPEALPRRVTVAFDGLALPAAIDRVLHGMSYALRYAPGAPDSKLWVLTSGDANAGPSAGSPDEPVRRDPPGAPPDGGAALRLEAVAALAGQDADPFAIALASAVADESVAVRYEAVHALGEIGGGISARLLQHALTDADPDIRAAAVDALGAAGGDQAVAALTGVLNEPDPALRERAVYALGEIGGDAARDLLERSAMDPDAFVREAAVDMLHEVRDED